MIAAGFSLRFVAVRRFVAHYILFFVGQAFRLAYFCSGRACWKSANFYGGLCYLCVA